jgi:ATP-dependent Clp protease protease subunit
MADREPALHTVEDLLEYEMLKARRIYYSGTVTTESTDALIRRLWYLELKNPGKLITLIINSPGGSIDAGFAVWDQAKLLRSPVATLITGLAASMGSVLSLCADKGRRFATPNARVLLHQPAVHGVVEGAASDLDIHAREILKTRDKMVELYSSATGQDPAAIRKVLDRDTWMSAQEALEFGLLDSVVESIDEVEKS